MVRALSIFLAIGLIFSFCACGESMVTADMLRSFQADVTVKIKDKSYSGKYSQYDNAGCIFEFLQPESLKGLEIACDGSGASMSLGDVQTDISDVASELMKLCTYEYSLILTENGICMREYIISDGTVKVYSDALNGFVTSVKCERMGLSAEFTNTVRL